MAANANIIGSRVMTVDDFLPLHSLTLDRALLSLPEELRANYGTAWNWFMQNSGTVGTRMHGKRIPGVSDDFPISAMRGIHVPSRTGIALSVTVSNKSIYSSTDKPLIHLPDGTWILEYSAHHNNTGGLTDMRWNEGLVNCLRLGLPVGVFIQQKGSQYVRYLAYVEEYHPDRGIFSLHGPITDATANRFASDILVNEPVLSIEYAGQGSVEELEEDNRRYARVRRAVREGQQRFRTRLMRAYDGRCACTGCDVLEALQAAHIIGYRGSRSNVESNGLLLRADVHLLFDNSLLTVDPGSLRFVTSERLANTEYVELADKAVRLPRLRELRPSEEYLAAHFEKFKQMELAS